MKIVHVIVSAFLLLVLLMIYYIVSSEFRPRSFIGIRFGEQISLNAINSSLKDESLLKREIAKEEILDFSVTNTVCYNYYPKSPLQGFARYQVLVDKNTKRIYGICGETGNENATLSVLTKFGKTDGGKIYSDTAGVFDRLFSGFSHSSHAELGGECASEYINRLWIFPIEGAANHAIIYYKVGEWTNFKVKFLVSERIINDL